MRGISATQTVQLVAQKLTRVTLPRRSAVCTVLPSSSTNFEDGAERGSLDLGLHPANATIARPMASMAVGREFNVRKGEEPMKRREFSAVSAQTGAALVLLAHTHAYA
jgi:hypothetical protein